MQQYDLYLIFDFGMSPNIFADQKSMKRSVGAEGMMPEICLSWNNISRCTMP